VIATEGRDTAERIQNLNRELRNRVAQLDESQRIIELRTLELQKLSSRVLHIQDEERRRIARDLHDDLGQQLAGLKMMLDRSRNQEASDVTDLAIATVRNLSYLLHPPLLDESGLRPALHWFVDGLVKRSNVDISLTIRAPSFPRLTSDIETTIFRVVQESLTNVFRHADTARPELRSTSNQNGLSSAFGTTARACHSIPQSGLVPPPLVLGLLACASAFDNLAVS
jgi:signal transduction histidine kinase